MSPDLRFEDGLVESGRQAFDQVDVAGELAVLFLGHAAGNEDPEMTDGFVDGVDDGLPERPDLVDVVIEVENPAERLLRRGDVVALRAEHHDRRTDVAKIDGGAVGGLDAAGGEIIADEQLVDDELDFFGIEIDVAAPPALELEVTLGFGVDLGIDVVLLGPKRVRGILVLEVRTSLPPSNLPPPMSLVRAVNQLPPSRPPYTASDILPRTPAQYDSGEPATIIGPNNSGRTDARIIIAQPAWQFPITQGLPSASGWSEMTFSTNAASATPISSMVWPGMGSGRKPTK